MLLAGSSYVADVAVIMRHVIVIVGSVQYSTGLPYMI